MTDARRDGIYLLLLGLAVFLAFSLALEVSSPTSMIDFKGVFYGARSLLQHHDPYNFDSMKQAYRADWMQHSDTPPANEQYLPRFFYLPTVFVITVPFALLPYSIAHLLWLGLLLAGVLLSSYLTWDLAAAYSPLIAGFLVGLLAANSELAVYIGNPAGIAISLCVIAVWCFLRSRYLTAGVICLSLALMIKPHDVAFVWLYFLIAGAGFRRYALRSLLLVVLLSIPFLAWTTLNHPGWVQELYTHLVLASRHGAVNDPGPASSGGHGVGMLISLQTALGILKDDPAFYNPLTYLIIGALAALWAAITVRLREPGKFAWIALAAIAPLSLLPIYHRQSDAMLLFLVIPACALMGQRGTSAGRAALIITAAAIFLTGDLTWALFFSVLQLLPSPSAPWLVHLRTAVMMGTAP